MFSVMDDPGLEELKDPGREELLIDGVVVIEGVRLPHRLLPNPTSP